MADYLQTVDRVRTFLAGADQTRTTALSEVASAYADVCQEVNTRLRRCVDYLHRGLRSEAIQLADCHPNLLDMIGALDLPEIADWERLCAAYDMTRPGRMMIEAAQELNEAYAQEQPLHDLLVRHRLLALAKAPLHERLTVLRGLTAADPNTPCWIDDQEAFERARLTELRSESIGIIRSRNVADIDRLLSEISQEGWRVTVPGDLKESLGSASKELHAEDALVQLREMVPEVRLVLQAGSLTRAKQFVARWEQIVRQYQVQPPQELTDEIMALRQWVSEEEMRRSTLVAFEAACVALRGIVNANVPQDVLMEHHRALEEFGCTIPADLERDYRKAVKKLERTQRYEQLGIFVLVAAVALAILIGGILVMWNTVRHR